MFLTTVRIHRASRRDVDAAITNTAELAALPRDEQRRLDVLAIHIGGHLVALVDPSGRGRVIWQHEKLLCPAADVLKLTKPARDLMDVVGGEQALQPDARAAGGPFERPIRGRARSRAGARS